MAENADPGFTAEQAARTLAELPGYEEQLTLRTAGITWMIWGLAVPGIFLSYGFPQGPLIEIGLGWLYAVLWVPWIAGASWATDALWRSHAITLEQEGESSAWTGWGVSLGFTLLFLAMLATLVFLGPPLASGAYPILVTGLFTIALGLVNRYVWGYQRQEPVYLVGAAITVAGLVIGLSATGLLVSALGALAVAAGYFSLGGYYLARG